MFVENNALYLTEVEFKQNAQHIQNVFERFAFEISNLFTYGNSYYANEINTFLMFFHDGNSTSMVVSRVDDESDDEVLVQMCNHCRRDSYYVISYDIIIDFLSREPENPDDSSCLLSSIKDEIDEVIGGTDLDGWEGAKISKAITCYLDKNFVAIILGNDSDYTENERQEIDEYISYMPEDHCIATKEMREIIFLFAFPMLLSKKDKIDLLQKLMNVIDQVGVNQMKELSNYRDEIEIKINKLHGAVERLDRMSYHTSTKKVQSYVDLHFENEQLYVENEQLKRKIVDLQSENKEEQNDSQMSNKKRCLAAQEPSVVGLWNINEEVFNEQQVSISPNSTTSD